MPNLAEAAEGRQTELQNTGRSDAGLSHPGLQGRTFQFTQSAGETLRDLPVDRTLRQEAAQNALARFLGAPSSAGAEEDIYVPMSSAQTENEYEPMNVAQTPAETGAPTEGEYSYARTFGGATARAPAGTGAPAEDQYVPMTGAQAEYVNAPVSDGQETYEPMNVAQTPAEAGAPAEDEYVPMTGAQAEGVNAPAQDEDLYTIPENIYDHPDSPDLQNTPPPLPPRLKAGKDRIEKLSRLLESKQMKGVRPEVRKQVAQLVADGKVYSQNVLMDVIKEKTMVWVMDNRADQWYQEAVDDARKKGMPVDKLAAQMEDPFLKLQTEIMSRDGLVNYDDNLKSTGRKIMREHVMEQSFLEAEKLLK